MIIFVAITTHMFYTYTRASRHITNNPKIVLKLHRVGHCLLMFVHILNLRGTRHYKSRITNISVENSK